MRITPKRLRRIVVCASFLSWVVLAGCAAKETSEKNLVLTGKVTYNNKPVTGGRLKLVPVGTNTMVPVDTQIRGDGTYSIVAPGVGEMKVTVETEMLRNMPSGGEGPYVGAPKGSKQPKMDPSQRQVYVKIPKKYSDEKSTDLTVTITNTKDGKNVKDFELKD